MAAKSGWGIPLHVVFHRGVGKSKKHFALFLKKNLIFLKTIESVEFNSFEQDCGNSRFGKKVAQWV
ncbi:MAG: hypothetical protein K1Y36_20055 [Blastocatellia bacterium]|nr:hypothetical protein [Blastocatellia bacterium]